MGSALQWTAEDDLSVDEALAAVEASLPVQQRPPNQRGKSAQQKMAIALQVLTLVRQGKTLTTIGNELGYSPSTVMHYRNLAFKVLGTPVVDDVRAEHLEITKALIEANMPAALNGDEKASSTVLKALDRQSKLLGLDKPIQVDAVITEVTAQERELQELLSQAQRDQQTQEQIITGEIVEDQPTTSQGTQAHQAAITKGEQA